jgi:hypothetical protein
MPAVVPMFLWVFLAPMFSLVPMLPLVISIPVIPRVGLDGLTKRKRHGCNEGCGNDFFHEFFPYTLVCDRKLYRIFDLAYGA